MEKWKAKTTEIIESARKEQYRQGKKEYKTQLKFATLVLPGESEYNHDLYKKFIRTKDKNKDSAGVDRHVAETICKALNLKLEEVAEIVFSGKKTHQKPLPENFINLCRNKFKLESQKLSSNPLTKTNRNLEDIFVPLGLIEQKQDRYENTVGDRKRNHEKITKKFSNNKDFYQTVFIDRNTPISKGKRIAIVGEPGSGKTTQLQKIANWILYEKKDIIPIWVSLNAIGKQPLKKYLLDNWLTNVAQEIDVAPPEWKKTFIKLLKNGNVWLFLDGIDEMVSKYPLHDIATQLSESWARNIQIILTCRLNLWNLSKNHLDNFNVYRNLDFDNESINQFIENWFEPINLQQGIELQSILKQPEKEQIRRLVKNPLRLNLLCLAWQKYNYREERQLPTTKAELYKWYSEAFYDWNEEKVSDKFDKTELNKAFGLIALEAIQNDDYRLCLTESLISKYLGKSDNLLFKAAINLGWLNYIGESSDNPLEKTYDFSHFSFLEYFAALAIDDWHCLFNHVNSNVQQEGTYKVFEPKWQEVILFWIGRSDLDKSNKNEFIQAILEFNDSCEFFYKKRSISLVVYLLSEFKQCSFFKEIIIKLIKKTFGVDINLEFFCVDDMPFDRTESEWIKPGLNYLIPYLEEGIDILENIINYEKSQDYISSIDRILTEIDRILTEMYLSLGKINPNNSRFIKFLISCLEKPRRFCHKEEHIEELLLNVNPGNPEAIKGLLHFLSGGINDYNLYVAGILSKIAVGDKQVINFLEQQINISKKKRLILGLSRNLLIADPNNRIALDIVENLSQSSGDEYSRCEAASIIFRTKPNNKKARELIISLLDKDSTNIAYTIINSNFDDYNTTKAIKILLNDCVKQKDEPYYWLEREDLADLLINNPNSIQSLVNLLPSIQNLECLKLAIWLVRNIVGHSYYSEAISILEKLLEIYDSDKNSEIYFETVITLGKLDSKHPTVLHFTNKIVDYLEALDVNNENIADELIDHLGIFAFNNKRAINYLIQVVKNHKNKKLRSTSAQALIKIGNKDVAAIDTLLQLIIKQDVIIILNSEVNLSDAMFGRTFYPFYEKYITPDYFPQIVKALKSSPNSRYRKFLLEHCAKYMSYPEFHHVWHSNDVKVKNLERQFSSLNSNLEKLSSTDNTYSININLKYLESTTDISEIAQELCNQIYQVALPNIINIPEINNAAQLKRIVPQLKQKLETDNLILVLYDCDPYQELITFCRKLSNTVTIFWITDKTLEPPLIGIPMQDNLISKIQSRIDNID